MICGNLEPTMKIGAPGIVPIENAAPCGGNGVVEKPIWAEVNASLNASPASPLSGRLNQKDKAFANFSAPDAICQWAAENILMNWAARNSASGSPSVYLRFTAPGWAAR